jgi:hypothetical protein
MIVEHREVDVGASGDLKIAGVAATVDPASVQLETIRRSRSHATALHPGRRPRPRSGRHVGEAVSVITTKGDVTGVLRSVDDQSLVVEIGSGRPAPDRRDAPRRLRAGRALSDRRRHREAELAWRLATKKPGKHQVELSYRADGMS